MIGTLFTLKQILPFLEKFDDILWSYIGVYFILLTGLYFTIKSKGFQFKAIAKVSSTYKHLYGASKDKEAKGINPFKLYFASVGGMIGIGNLVVVVTAITAGGPGALLWLWASSFAGMLLKYSEIFLGVKFRESNNKGGYDGGPMFYLKKAFNIKILPILSAILLCVYGAEVVQFKAISDTISQTFSIDWLLVAVIISALVLYSAIGGVRRLATICTVIMPFFLIAYFFMCLWVIGSNFHLLPNLLLTVVKSAFVGHAPVAGFLGSTALASIQYGVARAVYSGDIGIGYDSIVQSETKTKHPEYQARLAIFGQLTDTIICTCTVLVVLLTGAWYDPSVKEPSQYIIKALSLYFPYVGVFMSILFFITGYSTIIAYFTVGTKCASFIMPKIGKKIYVTFGIIAFLLTKYFDQSTLILIMSISGGLLIVMNISAIIKLRNYIKFR
ncbi:MAG: sodium:alanine symporter family protein [Rickettsiales bacterium]|nr:sodium:alanine symporter family protein [Rickettsiales bacterium]